MGTTTDGTAYYRVVDFFKPKSSNNIHGNTYGINHNYSAYGTNDLTTTNLIYLYIKNSIDNNHPVIIHAKTSYFSYYYGTVFGHFICLVGYIPGENKYIVRDCNNNDYYFGEFIVTGTEILNMLPSTYNGVTQTGWPCGSGVARQCVV